MSFTPELFIDIGEQACFFTLRETYLHTVHIPGPGPMGNAVLNGVYQGSTHTEVRSFHHYNLSQDPDEAFEKAQAAAERMGLHLNTSRESLMDELNKIRRANAEELERRERERREREERWAAEREAEEARKRELVRSGKFAIGPYAGQEFTEAPRGYLSWLMDTLPDFEEGSLMKLTAEQVTRQVPELALPKPDPELLLGEPKKRMTFEVTVVRRRYFDREAYMSYGAYERVYIVTMVDKATGACLLSKSAAFSPDEGEELTLKGTVKEHSEYNGQAQTVLQRIAIQNQ